jgi:hypothetical protein
VEIPLEDVLAYLKGMVRLRTELLSSKTVSAFPYSCLEHFLLIHGRSWTPAPYPRRWRRGVPQSCFANSLKLARRKKLLYVEGVALCVIPVHHAWNAHPRTLQVIDSTWQDDWGAAYFGVPFNPDFVATTTTGSALDDWHQHWPLLQGKVSEVEWRDPRYL